jgi:hypothetical protein
MQSPNGQKVVKIVPEVKFELLLLLSCIVVPFEAFIAKPTSFVLIPI